MKIKHAPIGSTVKQNGNEAIILSHGAMGCRVRVKETKDPDAITLGDQVWSALTEVKIIKEVKL